MALLKKHLDFFYHEPHWEAPDMIYGRNLIREITDTDEKYAVITMPIPWELVAKDVVNEPAAVYFVPNMYLETMEEMEKSLPPDIEMVVGIGGGSSHDAAKYVAMKRQCRLLQMPTIFGGDSVVCNAIGIREERKVRYIGHTYADKIYVDFGVIQQAPKHLIRYGAADILSSYTALMDWELASSCGKEVFLPEKAAFAKNVLLRQLMDHAEDIRQCTDLGIKTMVELFLAYAKLANEIDTDRAQEGSEHFFCYNAEYVTSRTYIHGALLSMGIYLSGSYLHGKKEETEAMLNALGLPYTLESAGLSKDEFIQTLRTLDTFTQKGNYYYSAINYKPFSEELIQKIMDDL